MPQFLVLALTVAAITADMTTAFAFVFSFQENAGIIPRFQK